MSLMFFSERTRSVPILTRIARNDLTAVKDCVDEYGGFIWSMAKRFTESTKEAETATAIIFLDIWRVAGRLEESGLDEQAFIAAVARCRLRGLV